MPEGEARWIADPTHRHELRWWNGTRWTEHVSDRGIVGADWGPEGPPPLRPRAQATPSEEHGEPRGLLEPTPQQARERERRSTFVLVAAAVLLLVALAIVVAVLMSSGGSGDNGSTSSAAEDASGASTAATPQQLGEHPWTQSTHS